MGRYSGKDLYVEFAGTDLSGDFRTLDVPESCTIIDASAGSDTYKDKLAGQTDATASLSMLHQAAGTVLWDALAPTTEGTLIWAPEGTASAKPKHSATVIVSSRGKSIPYEGVVELSVDFDIKSAITDTIY